MFSKIIFVLATVCVINASVITVKDNDDDPVNEVASNPKDCNLQACDQLCRRLKFPGGACINGRCKCYNFLNAKEDVSEENPTDLEDFISLKGDDPEMEVASNPKDCNFQACDQLCRRLKFPGGACVNGRCKCDYFLNALEHVPDESLSSLEDSIVQQDDNDIEAESKKSNCNNQACDQLCRRLKFTGGVCINGRCKCDNFVNAEVSVLDDSLSNPEDSVSPKACRSDKCNELCVKLKLGGGACIDGCCVCNKRLSQQDTMTDSVDALSLHSCNSITCDDQCRRSGWYSGVCINGQCKCNHFLNSEGAENSLTNFEDTLSPKRCTQEACNAFCRKLQFHDGVCDGARCRCHKYNPTPKGEVSEESLPVSELSEDPTKLRCESRVCHQFCRGLNLPGGVCVNGRCKCEQGTELNAVEEYLKFATTRVCRLIKCNRTCTRRGYEGATCVKGLCKCYNITKTSLPVSELSDNPTAHSCNMQACDQLCRRLKFPGGACVNGRCKCDNFLGIDVDAVDKNSELATTRVCDLRRCNRTCTRRGYAGARCVNGWCQCYDKIQREDASLLNDVTSDENEESNEVLSNEEQLSYRGPAPSVCNVVSCSQCTVFCLAVSGVQ